MRNSTRLRRALGLAAWALTGWLTLQPATAQLPPPSPNTARIWFYRDYDPYVNRNYATVLINGTIAGSVQPYGGTLYRDVLPGAYHLTVQSPGTDYDQDAHVELAPGQQAYVKVENLPSWDSGGGLPFYTRDTYYLRVIPPEAALAQMALTPHF